MTNLSTEQQLRERYITLNLAPEQAKNILKRLSEQVGSAEGGAYISAQDFGDMLLDPWGSVEAPADEPTLDDVLAPDVDDHHLLGEAPADEDRLNDGRVVSDILKPREAFGGLGGSTRPPTNIDTPRGYVKPPHIPIDAETPQVSVDAATGGSIDFPHDGL